MTSVNKEHELLMAKANIMDSVEGRVARSSLERVTMLLVREHNPKSLDTFLRMCILKLQPVPAIRVLRASFRARTSCGPWRPFCVKTFYDYAKEVGEETARADMAGLFEDFIHADKAETK